MLLRRENPLKRSLIRNIVIPNSLEDKINVEDKINLLENQIAFYRLMASKNIDLKKSITAVYADKPLKQICEELIPSVPIEFQGVDPNEIVGSMKITNAPLEQVLQYLDEAAGVNFSFSNKGILVQSGPNPAPKNADSKTTTSSQNPANPSATPQEEAAPPKIQGTIPNQP